MTLAIVVSVLIRISVGILVFALGLDVSPRDILYLLRDRALLLSSVLSMNVLMPLFAGALAVSFKLEPAVEAALVILSISPVPPLLPMQALRARGARSYMFSLLVVEAALAILFVPISVKLFWWTDRNQPEIGLMTVAFVVLTTVLIPLGAGMLMHRISPRIARKAARRLSIVAAIVLIGTLVAILIKFFTTVVSLIGNGTLAATIVFIAAGVAAGHFLGAPKPENRTVLALSTASRHPGVALAIAGAIYPQPKLVFAAILLYILVTAAVLIPYLAWRRRRIEPDSG
ncbi:MAG TPA: Na+-dependent transporter [Blastocatellia bacterium]|nr:Na+-dependent transporter [Blastocatellia bacterium]